MVRFFISEGDHLSEINEPRSGCWVHMVVPSAEEIERLSREFRIPVHFFKTPMDEDACARIDHDDGCALLVADTPIIRSERGIYEYSTLPVGVILTKEIIVTVCMREALLFADFLERRTRTFSTERRTRFMLLMMERIAGRFLSLMRQIDKASSRLESVLTESVKNQELIEMLKLEKSLVFFAASLKGNGIVLENLTRDNRIDIGPEDSREVGRDDMRLLFGRLRD